MRMRAEQLDQELQQTRALHVLAVKEIKSVLQAETQHSSELQLQIERLQAEMQRQQDEARAEIEQQRQEVSLLEQRQQVAMYQVPQGYSNTTTKTWNNGNTGVHDHHHHHHHQQQQQSDSLQQVAPVSDVVVGGQSFRDAFLQLRAEQLQGSDGDAESEDKVVDVDDFFESPPPSRHLPM